MCVCVCVEREREGVHRFSCKIFDLLTEIIILAVPIRLVNGTDQDRGRVEVQIAGQWGPICADYWNRKDAQVVCHMLGYNYQ